MNENLVISQRVFLHKNEGNAHRESNVGKILIINDDSMSGFLKAASKKLGGNLKGECRIMILCTFALLIPL